MYISIKSNLSFFFLLPLGVRSDETQLARMLARDTRRTVHTGTPPTEQSCLDAFSIRETKLSVFLWKMANRLGHNKQQFRLLSTTSTMYTTYIAKFISNSQKAKCEARMQAKETPLVIDKCKFGWPQCAKRWNVGRISTKCLSFVALSGG